MGKVVTTNLLEYLFTDKNRLTLGRFAGGLEQTQCFQTLVVDTAGEEFVQRLAEGQILNAVVVE